MKYIWKFWPTADKVKSMNCNSFFEICWHFCGTQRLISCFCSFRCLENVCHHTHDILHALIGPFLAVPQLKRWSCIKFLALSCNKGRKSEQAYSLPPAGCNTPGVFRYWMGYWLEEVEKNASLSRYRTKMFGVPWPTSLYLTGPKSTGRASNSGAEDAGSILGQVIPNSLKERVVTFSLAWGSTTNGWPLPVVWDGLPDLI